MSTMPITDARRRFGALIRKGQTEPVHIQKRGKDVAVFISVELYEALKAAQSAPQQSTSGTEARG